MTRGFEIPAEVTEKYDALEEIHRGGMGVVYKGRHRRLGQWRAIKLILPSLLEEDAKRQRFLREARIASQLDHPNIVRVFDFEISTDGTPYLAMELIEGHTLLEALRQNGPFEPSRAVTVGLQALDGLKHLHQKGYVHRDISPRNVLLTEEQGQETVKLVDLGIARRLDASDGLTRTAEFLFNARYSSPEHFIDSSAVDERSDLYSLGAVLYEILTGHRPIPGETPGELVGGHLRGLVRPFDETDPGGRVPVPLRKLVLRALAREPAERFDRADDMHRALLEFEVDRSAVTRDARGVLRDAGSHGVAYQAMGTWDDLDLRPGQKAAPEPPPQSPPASPLGPSAVVTQPPPDPPATPEPPKLFGPWPHRAALLLIAVLLLALDAVHWTPWTDLASPTPMPIQPHRTNAPILEWRDVFEMSQWPAALHAEFPYVVQIARDPRFREVVFDAASPGHWSPSLGAQASHRLVPLPHQLPPQDPALSGRETLDVVWEDGPYFWRVARQDVAGNLFGFSKPSPFAFDATPPAQVSLEGEDRPINVTRPELTWQVSPGASRYWLQVADVPFDEEQPSGETLFAREWDHIPPSGELGRMNWQVPEPLPEGDIYWRVRSCDDTGNCGTFPPAMHFEVDITDPEAPTVADLAELTNDPLPTFTWDAISDATDYEVVVRAGEAYDQTVYRLWTTETFFQPSDRLPEGLNGWQVRSRDAAGNMSPFAFGGTFEVDTTPPRAPQIYCHDPSLVNTTEPLLEWIRIEDAENYRLEILPDASRDPLVDSWLHRSAFSTDDIIGLKPPKALPQGSTLWRVTSRDLAGNLSVTTSNECHVKVDSIAPALPKLATVPALSNQIPTLRWTLADDMVALHLEVLGPGDSTAVRREDFLAQEHRPHYLDDGRYRWRLKGRDEAGNWTAFVQGNVFELDTRPPEPSTPTAPSAGLTNDRAPVFRWNAARDAVAHVVRASQRREPDAPLLFEKRVEGGRELLSPEKLPEGDIFWWVTSFDSAGNATTEAPKAWFEVDVTPPPKPEVDTAPRLSCEPPQLSWSNSPGAETYRIYVDDVDTRRQPDFEETLERTYLQLDRLDEGRYNWWVESQDGADNLSGASATGLLVIDCTPPSPPRLEWVEPAQEPRPILRWEIVPDALEYELEILQGDRVILRWIADGGWSRAPKALPPGLYGWRVRSFDDLGNEGRFSPISDFRILPPY